MNHFAVYQKLIHYKIYYFNKKNLLRFFIQDLKYSNHSVDF